MPDSVEGRPAASIVPLVDLTNEVPPESFLDGLRAHWNQAESLAEVVSLAGGVYWQEAATTVTEARAAIDTIDGEQWQEWCDHAEGREPDAGEQFAELGGWR